MSTQTATTAARFAMRESGSPDSTSSESDDDVYIPDAEADNHPGRSVSRPSASLAKKVLQRAHAKSNASSVITAPSKITKRKVQRKRARTSTPQRQAQSAQPEQPLGNGELAKFTTTIFMIQLGDNGHHFHAHESVLRRSPKLSEDIAAAQSKKRVSLHNLLPLMPHNPVAFEQMLEYLYNDRVQLTKSQPSASARMDEIRELFSLAKYYLLPELQKHVVKLFSDSNILNKVTSAKFFDWAEDMYSEELDIENGPFKSYFALVAPTLLCKVTPGLMEEVCRMVKVGGTFAVELFKACHRALTMNSVVKEED